MMIWIRYKNSIKIRRFTGRPVSSKLEELSLVIISSLCEWKILHISLDSRFENWFTLQFRDFYERRA
jgi:hypothetical protein